MIRKVSSIEEKKRKKDIVVTKEEEVLPGYFVDYFKPKILKKFLKPHLQNNFFLSHFHTDHLHSLSNTWDIPYIFTTLENGKLLVEILGVNPDLIRVPNILQPIFIKSNPVQVYMLPSNHIIGSCMFLFQCNGKNLLHTTDFRYDKKLRNVLKPMIEYVIGKRNLDTIYLDCTNCSHESSNDFPSVEECARDISQVIKIFPSKFKKKVVFYISVYNVGKETIIMDLLEEYGISYCFEVRRKIMAALHGREFVEKNFTNVKSRINFVSRKEWLHVWRRKSSAREILVFIKPSCWSSKEYLLNRVSDCKFMINIPCTSHSSPYELKLFLNDFASCNTNIQQMYSTNKNWLQIIRNSTPSKPNKTDFFENLKSIRNIKSCGDRLPELAF